jgi:hypothetical protein
MQGWVRYKEGYIVSEEIGVHLDLLEPVTTEGTHTDTLKVCLEAALQYGGEQGLLVKINAAENFKFPREYTLYI